MCQQKSRIPKIKLKVIEQRSGLASTNYIFIKFPKIELICSSQSAIQIAAVELSRTVYSISREHYQRSRIPTPSKFKFIEKTSRIPIRRAAVELSYSTNDTNVFQDEILPEKPMQRMWQVDLSVQEILV